MTEQLCTCSLVSGCGGVLLEASAVSISDIYCWSWISGDLSYISGCLECIGARHYARRHGYVVLLINVNC